MDCHVSLFHSIPNKVKNMKAITNRFEEQILDGIKIQVLEIHDRLLHLVAHFTKEIFRCDVRWYITGERYFDNDYCVKLPLLFDIALMIDKYKTKIDWELLKQRALKLCCQDELFIVLRILKEIYPDLIDTNIDANSTNDNNFFKYKYNSMFYALELGKESAAKILESTLSQKSNIIMEKSISLTPFCLGRNYLINEIDDSDLVQGHRISEKENSSIGTIKFDMIEKNFLINIESAQISKVDIIYLTIGTPKYNNVLNAFINKFYINLKKQKESYAESGIKSFAELGMHNGYINLSLKYNVEIDRETINVNIPKSLLSLDNNSKYILFDIGIPELQKSNTDKKYILQKYGINDIGHIGLGDVFHCSPKLLTTINLINGYIS